MKFCLILVVIIMILANADAELRIARILLCIQHCNQNNGDLAPIENNELLRDTRTESFPGCVIFSSFRCVCVQH